MHLRKAALLGKFQRRHKVLLGFAREAYDNVRRNRHVRHLRTNLLHQLRKALRVIRTVHRTQNLVAAALQRQVQVTQKARLLRHQLQEARLHLYGFQRAKAHTLHALDRQRCLHCVIQRNLLALLRQLLAIAAKVNANEHNLLIACSHKLCNLLANACKASAAQRSTGKGNNAIGAILVAALLNLQEGTRLVRFCAYAQLLKFCINGHLLYIIENFCLLMLQRLIDQLHDTRTLLVADDNINALNSTHLFRRSLRIAAGNNNERQRIVTHSAVDNLARLALTCIRNNAGVHQINVSLLAKGHNLVARRAENPLHAGCVGLINLAA